MNISLRSSQSSYGDPRYLSTATVSDMHAPQSKGLVYGYRDTLDPQHGDRSRFNPVRGTPIQMTPGERIARANQRLLLLVERRSSSELGPFERE